MEYFVQKIEKAELGKTHLFSIGQAGYVIKSSSGQKLGIDLCLSECVERVEHSVGFKRLLPAILAPEEVKADVLVCTHFHRDHYDIDAVPAMMQCPKTRLFCPKDCEPDIENGTIDKSRVTIIQPGDVACTGDFKLRFINCDHGTGAPLAVGVIIEVDGFRLLFVGDTRLRLDRKQEYLSSGPLDILIAPINGAYGNLNEEECAILSSVLEPKITVPSHYGLFAAHGGNPGQFYDIMTKKYPERSFVIMGLGECYTL